MSGAMASLEINAHSYLVGLPPYACCRGVLGDLAWLLSICLAFQ